MATNYYALSLAEQLRYQQRAHAQICGKIDYGPCAMCRTLLAAADELDAKGSKLDDSQTTLNAVLARFGIAADHEHRYSLLFDAIDERASRLGAATLRFEHEERLRRAAEAGGKKLGADLQDEMRKNSELSSRLQTSEKMVSDLTQLVHINASRLSAGLDLVQRAYAAPEGESGPLLYDAIVALQGHDKPHVFAAAVETSGQFTKTGD